jgi:excisionase family DNA binding protein
MRCSPAVSPEPLQLLTPDKVADLLGIERLTVIRLARAKKIPAIKVGKAVRFRPAAIETWLAQREQACA